MKILVTGATGFVGAHTIQHFAKLGHTVVALGRNPKPSISLTQQADYICADIQNKLPYIACDICIHTAGSTNDKGSFDHLREINVTGTANVFEATASAKHFIHISSSSVYNNTISDHKEDENILLDQLSPYGKSKRLAELYLLTKVEKNKTTILRPRAIYGIRDRVLLPRILKLKKGKKIIVPGHLRVNTSLTHIDNLLYAIELSIAQKESSNQIYNISDGVVYELRQIVEKIIYAAYGPDINVMSLPIQPIKKLLKLLQALGISSNLSEQSIDYVSNDFTLNISKISRELGYHPKTHFAKALPLLTRWMRKLGAEKITKHNYDLPWQIYH